MPPQENKFSVPWEKTRWNCTPTTLEFACTDEVNPLDHFIGQDRALESIRFGLEVTKPGYNLFVTGLTGTGKASAIKAHLETIVEEMRQEERQQPINDWCYVHNFDDVDRPHALRMPQGTGRVLRTRLGETLQDLKREITQLFKGDEYQTQVRTLEEEGRQATQQLMADLQQSAKESSFAIQFSSSGLSIYPLKADNQPMGAEEYQQLSPEERQAIDERRNQLMQQTQSTMERVRELEKDTADKIKALERVVADERVSAVFQEVISTFRDLPDVSDYLNRLIDYVLDNLNLFREQEQQQQAQQPGLMGMGMGGGQQAMAPSGALARNPFLPFEISLLVDESGVETVPIIVEPNPNWGNLFGRIERRASFGTYISDHTMLKPGSVHLANGGYLVLNAREVLLNPGVWEGLKRVIRNREVRLEDPAEQAGIFVPQGLRPEPIPLDLKVIITGDDTLYRLLTSADYEDFWDLFKVKAEFDSQIDQSQDNLQAYCAFISRTCAEEELLGFEASGAAKVVEHAARLVSDQTKLSSRFGQIKDLLIESDYWARKDSSPTVLAKHVNQAITHKVYRVNLIEERVRELIAEGSILIDVTDSVPGQVNALSVYDLGDFSFGKPSRITAQTFAGRSGVINIERESALSGSTHDKGVLILSGYLGAKYGQQSPLTLSVSLAFEQSYNGVDGDSASSSELYAVLSSLSGLPLKQSIAVTGSVNQRGEIQPIGGVNQKVEGMFDVCRVAGLTGEQGVMIPHQNVKNLMLREDVVEAIKEGRFHIYAVETLEEGIEVLTGYPAGERRDDGTYPEGTTNYLVDRRLHELNQSMRGYYGELLATGH